MAVSGPEPPCHHLHLVKLSPRPGQSGVTCTDAWCFCCAALRTRNLRGGAGCDSRCDQSISSNSHCIFHLSSSLENRGEPCRHTIISASRSARAVPWIRANVACSGKVERRNAEIEAVGHCAATKSQPELEKSIARERR